MSISCTERGSGGLVPDIEVHAYVDAGIGLAFDQLSAQVLDRVAVGCIIILPCFGALDHVVNVIDRVRCCFIYYFILAIYCVLIDPFFCVRRFKKCK